MHVPGHTRGALAYLVESQGDPPPAVFTGDTLFLAGCGRLFEGTPEAMHASLTRLAMLTDVTRVYCGHEYTEANLRFAVHVDGADEASVARLRRVIGQRGRGEPTVPGTMAEERATNPFLRLTGDAVRARLGLERTASPVEVFAAMRKAKDGFRAT